MKQTRLKAEPAEVTSKGVKARGSPEKGAVVVNKTPTAAWKKRLLIGMCVGKSIAIAVGLAMYWEPHYDHLAWATVVVTSIEMTVLTFNKVG